MALSFVGGAENSNEEGNAILTLPGGIATDDVVYVCGGWNAGLNGNPAVITAGYTELADLAGPDTEIANFSANRKVMGATPDASVTCTADGGGVGGALWAAHVWRGADTTTPEDATTTTATGGNDANPVSPAIITATANAVVLSAGLGTVNDTTVTAPTSYINQIDRDIVALAPSTVGIASRSIVSPGSETPGAWTGFASTASDSWAAVSIAIRPAATTPVAEFSGTPRAGTAPLTVTFTDESTNTPTSWAWDFGDGGDSSAQNPTHEYTTAGTYTVALEATNAAGSDTETKVDYVSVTISQPARGNAGALLASWEKLQPKRKHDQLARDRGKFAVLITPEELAAEVAARHLDSDTDAMIADLMREFEERFMEWDRVYIGVAIKERDRLLKAREARLRKEAKDREEWLKRRGRQERKKKA